MKTYDYKDEQKDVKGKVSYQLKSLLLKIMYLTNYLPADWTS